MEKLDSLRREIDRIDREMAQLFCQRMRITGDIAAVKRDNALPICDQRREQQILSRTLPDLPAEYGEYYRTFQRGVMEISKQYQRAAGNDIPRLLDGAGVVLQRSSLNRAGEWLNLRRKVFLITDDGVPAPYICAVTSQCDQAHTLVLPQGEASKCTESLLRILERMTSLEMKRDDCVVALGGGMIGDLAGLAASLYMRGVDFYNIPTTLLSQVDASIGGKTAINFVGFKNTVGTFYRPQCVLMDPDVLHTLPRRQLSAGMAEALKISLTCDSDLFALFEAEDPFEKIDEIIARAASIKQRIVSIDPYETGMRRVLNFGHTIGHAIESSHSGLLHGECVALGMLPMCCETIRARLLPIYGKLGLPTVYDLDTDRLKACMIHDKKQHKNGLFVVEVSAVGTYTIRPRSAEELIGRLGCIMKGVNRP